LRQRGTLQWSSAEGGAITPREVHAMFTTRTLQVLLARIAQQPDRPALCAGGRFHTYGELGRCAARIRAALRDRLDIPLQSPGPGGAAKAPPRIGVVANDDLATYAAILAVWLEGGVYVPLHPAQPAERAFEIIDQAGLVMLLDSGVTPYPHVPTLPLARLARATGPAPGMAAPSAAADVDLAYILFTSGSTGKPKGVPLTRGNLQAFLDAFAALGYELDQSDRWLQPFELTFDLSIVCFLRPLLDGACFYTVPSEHIKFSSIAQLLDDQSLTFALMVPSTLRYLHGYFDQMHLPALRYSLFCGEALPLDLLDGWSRCAPHAAIDNVYGPTEDTIFCSRYRYRRDGGNKHCNGIVPIGRSMRAGSMIVVDHNDLPVPPGQQGELCLAGPQLTPGYLDNPGRNRQAFFHGPGDLRYYRTGDLCIEDPAGDFLFLGRIDSQVKIQGYRVELGEIEFHARAYLNGKNAVALDFPNAAGHTEVGLVVEHMLANVPALHAYLKAMLPHYMVPSKIACEDSFPLNANGKVDRNRLRKLLMA
jgi:D-alanine--poly(phosphoribitol) ligase subunit 1